MTTTQPQSLSPEEAQRNAQYRDLIKYTSIGALFICPLIIALPPRKLDAYTLVLLSCTAVGANQVSREYTGESILERMGGRIQSMGGKELPSERAREVQKLLREEREIQRNGAIKARIQAAEATGDESKIVAELKRAEEERARDEDKKRSVLQKIWMGGEKDDWKATRDAKEKEALEEGKGYGDLIMDQIWEVWSWGRDKTEDSVEVKGAKK
jgi:hypothetical protein